MNDMHMNEFIKSLAESFTLTGTDIRSKKQAYVTVKKQEAVTLITRLKRNEGYAHLSFLTAVDIIEQGRFELVYMLHNPDTHDDLGVKVSISRDDEAMESIHDLWAAAGTYQRELFEMFGIRFPGSPRLEEPFILEGWDNVPPMRREFDTKKYSEETYYPRPGRTTEDPAEHMAEKLYPEEAV